MDPQVLATVADVEDLIALLLAEARVDPVVVVTTRNHETEPLLDVDALAAICTPLPVRVLPTGPLTRHLTATLPDGLGVFGGAARIWWPGLSRDDEPRSHPLIFCYSAEEAPRALARFQAELERRDWGRSPYLVPVVAAPRPRESPRRGAELTATVLTSQPGGGEVELSTGVRSWLVRRRRDPDLVVGTSIIVTITGYDGSQPNLRRLDSPLPAGPAPLPLVVPKPRPPLEQPVADPLGEALHRAALMEQRAEVAESQLAEAARDAARAVRESKKEQRSLRDQVKHLKARLRGGEDVLDPEEAFRDQVTTAWERTTLGADREAWPLPDYQIGDAFLASLAAFPGLRTKVAEVCADVASGRFRTMPARDNHELRRGTGGAANQLVRSDGAKAYRIAVQIKTPSARRLHYWRLPDGSVELAKVVLHDDTSIT